MLTAFSDGGGKRLGVAGCAGKRGLLRIRTSDDGIKSVCRDSYHDNL